MILLATVLTFLAHCYLLTYDWNKYRETKSTGRVSLFVRIAVWALFTWIANQDFGVLWVSAGYNLFLGWWFWDSLTGATWYRSPFKTGETKFIDGLFKFVPDLFMWWIKFVLMMSFLAFYINENYDSITV